MREILGIRSKDVRKGRRGQNAFAKYAKKVFKSEEVEVWNNPYNLQGVDIIVKNRKGKPIKAIEVTNYSKTTWMSRNRAQRYIDSLKFWRSIYPDIYLAIVVSHSYAVDKIKGLRANKYGEKRSVRQMFTDARIEIWVWKEVI